MTTGAHEDRPREVPRDEAENAFTPLLRALLNAHPDVLAVVFVDNEGECIDYCSSIPPFDAKILGAHMMVLATACQTQPPGRGGEPWWLHVLGTERDLVVRRFGDDYALVVAARPTGIPTSLFEAIEHTVRELRFESGIGPPIWEPTPARVRVEVRLSTAGWAYAPSAFWDRGERTMVLDVLGRWSEQEPGATPNAPVREATCFLVRSSRGEELTLVHWLDEDAWERR